MKTRVFNLMALFFVAALTLSFTACGGDDDSEDVNSENNTENQTVTLDEESMKFVGAWRGQAPADGTGALKESRIYFGKDGTYRIYNYNSQGWEQSYGGTWKYDAEKHCIFTNTSVWEVIDVSEDTWTANLLTKGGSTYVYNRYKDGGSWFTEEALPVYYGSRSMVVRVNIDNYSAFVDDREYGVKVGDKYYPASKVESLNDRCRGYAQCTITGIDKDTYAWIYPYVKINGSYQVSKTVSKLKNVALPEGAIWMGPYIKSGTIGCYIFAQPNETDVYLGESWKQRIYGNFYISDLFAEGMNTYSVIDNGKKLQVKSNLTGQCLNFPLSEDGTRTYTIYSKYEKDNSDRLAFFLMKSGTEWVLSSEKIGTYGRNSESYIYLSEFLRAMLVQYKS